MMRNSGLLQCEAFHDFKDAHLSLMTAEQTQDAQTGRVSQRLEQTRLGNRIVLAQCRHKLGSDASGRITYGGSLPTYHTDWICGTCCCGCRSTGISVIH